VEQKFGGLHPQVTMKPALDHTIVQAHDKQESATFLADLLGLAAPVPTAPFVVVEIGNERANVEAAFGGLDLVWLSTSAGDDNVFLIQAADLPA